MSYIKYFLRFDLCLWWQHLLYSWSDTVEDDPKKRNDTKVTHSEIDINVLIAIVYKK